MEGTCLFLSLATPLGIIFAVNNLPSSKQFSPLPVYIFPSNQGVDPLVTNLFQLPVLIYGGISAILYSVAVFFFVKRGRAIVYFQWFFLLFFFLFFLFFFSKNTKSWCELIIIMIIITIIKEDTPFWIFWSDSLRLVLRLFTISSAYLRCTNHWACRMCCFSSPNNFTTLSTTILSFHRLFIF